MLSPANAPPASHARVSSPQAGDAGADQPVVSDNALIRLALRGDHDAYGELAVRYQDRLLTSIRNDVGCQVLAEDIVQDAFIRAFTHLDSFRGQSSFYTWLYRIALNSRRYYLRNRHRTMQFDSVCENPTQAWAENRESPADHVERREECIQVREAISRLDENHRTILVLREFEGFDYREISERLHLSMGTVRSRLSRARAQLKKELSVYVASRPVENVERFDNGDAFDRELSLTA